MAEAAVPARAPAPRRCIFVSHRQSDSSDAVHLANAILAYHPNGSDPYDVWLDVWDQPLARISHQAACRRQKALGFH